MSLTIPLAASGSSAESRPGSGFLLPVALGLGGGTPRRNKLANGKCCGPSRRRPPCAIRPEP